MLARLRPAHWIWPTLAAFLLAAAVWPKITAGFWTDEAGTWWIVRDGFGDAVARAEWWSATSPFYYSLLWAWSRLFGLGEVSLRLPSLLCGLASAALLHRLARFWFDAEGAWLAVVFFLMSRFVAFAVVDARPYSLGLMLLLAAWVSLLSWLEDGRRRHGVLFVLCAAGAVWAHYMLALGLLPLAWYLRPLGWRRALAALLGGALLLLPRAWQVAEVAGRRGQLSFARPAGALDLAIALFPLELAALAVLGALVATFATVRRPRGAPRDFLPCRPRRSLAPVALLAALPPLTLFLLSRFGGAQFFVYRYMIAREIGLALAAAWLVSGLTRRGLRAATAVAAALLAFALFLSGSSHANDWRSASRWAASRPGRPVAVASGFVESDLPGAVADPARRDILFAPQALYPVPGRPILLPMRPAAADARAILEIDVVPAARQHGGLLVLAGPISVHYRQALERRLGPAGLRLVEERNFEGIRGWRFERALPAASASIRPAALPAGAATGSSPTPASPPTPPAPSSAAP